MVGQFNKNFASNVRAIYNLDTVNDSSGNGNTLTNNNSVTLSNSGADFGSTDANKTLSTNNTMSWTGGAFSMIITLSLNTEISSGVYDILDLVETANHNQLLIDYNYNSGTRTLNFHRTRLGTADDTFAYTTTLGLNKYVIALTYDGTTLVGYLNGGVVGSVASSGNGASGGTAGFVIAGQTNDLTANNGLFTARNCILVGSALTPKQIKDYTAWALGRRAFIA